MGGVLLQPGRRALPRAPGGRFLQTVDVARPVRPSSEEARGRMKANRRRDTAPEMAIRRELHRLGLRFRVDLPLSPTGVRRRADIVFPRARVVVFVDGCFWHSCPIHATSSKSNAVFWAEKLATNVARDTDTDHRLRQSGWTVVRVWEHEFPPAAAQRVALLVLASREQRRQVARSSDDSRRTGSRSAP